MTTVSKVCRIVRRTIFIVLSLAIFITLSNKALNVTPSAYSDPSSSSKVSVVARTSEAPDNKNQRKKCQMKQNNRPPRSLRQLIIHAGPPKTSSTSLQLALQDYEVQLILDRYESPNQTDFKICDDIDTYAITTNTPTKNLASLASALKGRCSPETTLLQFKDFVASAFQRGNDVITSSEWLSIGKMNVELLQMILQAPNKYPTKFETAFIFYYRPLLEWLPSVYYQIQRSKIGTPFESFVDWLTSYGQLGRIMVTYTWAAKQQYENAGFDVKILPMRKTEDPVVKFFCEYVPNANRTCANVQAIQENNPTAMMKNRGSSIEYKRILAHARNEGLLSSEGYQQKDEEQLKQFVNRMGPDSIRRFMVCIPEQMREKLLGMALSFEDQMSCGTASQDATCIQNCTSDNEKKIIEAKFQEQLSDKFCSFNTTLMFEDVEWREFFKSLKG